MTPTILQAPQAPAVEGGNLPHAPSLLGVDLRRGLPAVLAAAAFLVLFQEPLRTLLRDWWSDPNASHGLLVGPLAILIAWRKGLLKSARPSVGLGLVIVCGAVALRVVSGLAAELFTMRFSFLMAGVGLVTFQWGFRQVVAWWLSVGLLLLSIPLPEVIVGTLALPLQLQASALGAFLLESRNIPVLLSGNVIDLPGQSLFVTEACSGLRSLTALLAIGLLVSGMWLRSPVLRAVVITLAIPVAMLLNGIRIFVTGFLVYFVDPRLGEGVLHSTEGWVIFVVAFTILAGVSWVLSEAEQRWSRRRAS